MKLYKVIAHDRTLKKGDIVRRLSGLYDDDHSKQYVTLDGEKFGYLMDKDIVPYEELAEEAELVKSTQIEKPLYLRIETDNNQTRIWLNGVEQKHITSIDFTHKIDGTPNLVLGHDIF